MLLPPPVGISTRASPPASTWTDHRLLQAAKCLESRTPAAGPPSGRRASRCGSSGQRGEADLHAAAFLRVVSANCTAPSAAWLIVPSFDPVGRRVGPPPPGRAAQRAGCWPSCCRSGSAKPCHLDAVLSGCALAQSAAWLITACVPKRPGSADHSWKNTTKIGRRVCAAAHFPSTRLSSSRETARAHARVPS